MSVAKNATGLVTASTVASNTGRRTRRTPWVPPVLGKTPGHGRRRRSGHPHPTGPAIRWRGRHWLRVHIRKGRAPACDPPHITAKGPVSAGGHSPVNSELSDRLTRFRRPSCAQCPGHDRPGHDGYARPFQTPPSHVRNHCWLIPDTCVPCTRTARCKAYGRDAMPRTRIHRRGRARSSAAKHLYVHERSISPGLGLPL